MAANVRHRNKKGERTILLVDSDLGFAFWLGQALDRAGYEAVPTRTPRAATELIEEHRISIDILVIDPYPPDAPSFISRLRQGRPSLKTVAAFPEESDEPLPMIEFDAIKRKPQYRTEEAAAQWVRLVQRLLPAHGGSSGVSR
jgi:hypothetical protein